MHRHHRVLWLAPLLGTLVWSSAARAETASDPESLKTEIINLDREYFKSIEARDFKKLGDLLADDYIHVHAHGTVDRKPAFLEYMRTRLKPVGTAELSELEVTAFSRDTAILVGKAKFSILLDGKQSERLMRYLHVYVRQNGKWLMAANESTAIK